MQQEYVLFFIWDMVTVLIIVTVCSSYKLLDRNNTQLKNLQDTHMI
jgi:hypothetical protein